MSSPIRICGLAEIVGAQGAPINGMEDLLHDAPLRTSASSRANIHPNITESLKD